MHDPDLCLPGKVAGIAGRKLSLFPCRGLHLDPDPPAEEDAEGAEEFPLEQRLHQISGNAVNRGGRPVQQRRAWADEGRSG